MRKILIFHWYDNNLDELNLFQKIHLYYFNKFKHIFDKIVISISTNNMNNNEHINNIKKLFIDDNTNDIDFRLINNDPDLREASTFKKFILDSDEFDNDYVFFAHSKQTDYTNTPESLSLWIGVMWYFNLTNLNDTIKKINNKTKYISSGVIKACMGEGWQEHNKCKYDHIYAGTFFWLNMKKFKAINIDTTNVNRFFVENIFANNIENQYCATSNNCDTNMLFLVDGGFDPYRNMKNMLPVLFTDTKLVESFNEDFNIIFKNN